VDKVMSDDPNPLPTAFREAFGQAIIRFDDWQHGGPEPSIQVEGKWITISGFCELIRICRDEKLSPELFDVVWRLPDETRRDLKERLAKDQSYHAAAHCLSELTKDKNRRYRNL
jgi:hypothetical protein